VVLWRFSQHDSLEGRGGLLAAARWHSKGRAILYCAPNPATALLEVLVHADVREPSALGHHQFVKIEAPDDLAREEVREGELPPDWARRVRVTRAWGDRWLAEGRSALLEVRSVLVPETYNMLINPRHADAARIRRAATFPYPLDARLIGRQ
jgi:RES domain-containing protein